MMEGKEKVENTNPTPEVFVPKTGTEFRNTGLLWFINTILHVFGWAIAWDSDTGNIYPAMVRYRGFDESSNTKGYQRVSRFLAGNYQDLLDAAMEENINELSPLEKMERAIDLLKEAGMTFHPNGVSIGYIDTSIENIRQVIEREG